MALGSPTTTSVPPEDVIRVLMRSMKAVYSSSPPIRGLMMYMSSYSRIGLTPPFYGVALRTNNRRRVVHGRRRRAEECFNLMRLYHAHTGCAKTQRFGAYSCRSASN